MFYELELRGTNGENLDVQVILDLRNEFHCEQEKKSAERDCVKF